MLQNRHRPEIFREFNQVHTDGEAHFSKEEVNEIRRVPSLYEAITLIKISLESLSENVE